MVHGIYVYQPIQVRTSTKEDAIARIYIYIHIYIYFMAQLDCDKVKYGQIMLYTKDFCVNWDQVLSN